MSDLDFEVLLGGRLRGYAEGGVRPVDRYAIARSTMASRRRLASRLGSPRHWSVRLAPRTTFVLAAGFALAALAGGTLLLSGGHSTAPQPTATPGSPSASPSSPPPQRLHGTYVRVADMAVGRLAPIMVTLADGRVLVVAGGIGTPSEVFDPVTGSFTRVDGGWGGIGSGVLLRDGRALVQAYDSNAVGSRLLVFDPRTMSFTQIGPNDPPVVRSPSLSLLSDGRVLIAGGSGRDVLSSDRSTVLKPVDTAEVFDPATDTLSTTGRMVAPREGHTATTLPDGRVLIVGGDDAGDAEIYDPATGTFAATASPPIPGGSMRAGASMRSMLLPDGRVLVLEIQRYGSMVLEDPQIYDPARRAFAPAPSLPGNPSAALLLGDGRIFLTGSSFASSSASGDPRAVWAAIYDPVSGVSITIDAPPIGWQEPALLNDGRILLVGGMTPSSAGNGPLPVPSAEILEW